ncbi:hypothetical protein [Photorhabdus heterorhabditis]|uniref:hypothetical protein n=1 Tax=Photorhabdus heterorhabditis TaxID=880156 RepID=UPI001562BE45|nr:hypothetical protein [Photorhabdus heterorhabditis]NRN29830.1 hypothetical protein [Photorhabdus heterorhabditis subsp. aluminescens]
MRLLHGFAMFAPVILTGGKIVFEPHGGQFSNSTRIKQRTIPIRYIPVIFQVASLLAALTHPGHSVIYDIAIYDIVIYAPGDSLPCRRDPS